jgi:hypothetical protein
MMKPFFLTVFFALVVFSLSSCATKEVDSTKEGREKVSTVPWSKPESWEGKGALGGLVQ